MTMRGKCRTALNWLPRRLPTCLLLAMILIWTGGAAWALQPTRAGVSLDARKLSKPELQVSSRHEPLAAVKHQLEPTHRAALDAFSRKHGQEFRVKIDPRSGTPSAIVGHIPLIPGSGRDNRLTLAQVGAELGEAIAAIDSSTVARRGRKFIQESREALNIDQAQVGEVVATQVNDHLWQLNAGQQVDGIKVRGARLSATINHGNLILIGTEKWGKVKIKTRPAIGADQALELGFQYADGRRSEDEVLVPPTLEIVPTAPQHLQDGDRYVGPPGQGYEHRLVWTFVFKRAPAPPRWEVMIDARTAEVLAFRDLNQYLNAGITGGIYPLTSTGVCPTPATCGTMQADQPMPFADTGLAAPNDFTNGAGLFEHTGGSAVTTLFGKYLQIQDMCGAISESSAGSIALGGSNGQHDCDAAGGSPGNTPAARSVFYEVNKLQEMARGYLPYNTWLLGQLQANVNIPYNPNDPYSSCNAYWNGSINFVRSSNGCRNTGEIAAVFDHEWAHGLDENDGNDYSSPSEAYADIAALFRLQSSCLGHGFFQTLDQGCGLTADGTGYNVNESLTGTHCALDCSGVRDADWDKHADHKPDTPANFVCTHCYADPNGYNGPCGRQAHCEAAVDRQAAWDFAARDLQAPPYNYDANTAFLVASRIFYLSSGSIGDWHSCSCSGSASNGCGATNAYLQWLAADDDDGDVSNGTPHMMAIYNAFNRHGIACAEPAPVNSGCAGAPDSAPVVTVIGGDGQVRLSWNGVSGAEAYRVFRSEGPAGCNLGKTSIATVTGSAFTDTALANDRQYCYTVMAVGANEACFSPASACTCAVPALGPHGTLQGVVRDLITNNSISGATVTLTGRPAIQTDVAGFYQFASIPAGSYEVTASVYGYQTPTAIPVTIGDGIVTTQDLMLNPFTLVPVEGRVTDASGHGWPLYATVTITASGYARTLQTDPATGRYSVALEPGVSHTVTVSTAGYLPVTRTVTPAGGGMTEDFALAVDGTTCTAEGYTDNYRSYFYNETFESSAGGYTASPTVPWQTTTWAWGAPMAGPGTGHSGSHVWGTNLPGNYSTYEDGYVTSPTIDLSANAGKASYLFWWQWLSDQYYWNNVNATVEVSNDDGATWSVVYHPTGVGTSTWTEARVHLSPVYSVSTFRVRFRWANTPNPGLFIDDIAVGPATCSPLPGGRLVGNVVNATTGLGINDAVVSDAFGNQTTSRATPDDQGLADGFYSLFLPAGTAALTVSRTGYESVVSTQEVTVDAVTRRDFPLAPAPLTIVQGTVTDASGHGWPLYATIEVTAPNFSQTVATDPLTGTYSLTLYGNTTYSVTVKSLDYTTVVRSITTASGAMTEDFPLIVAYCTALGYGDPESGGLLYHETFEQDGRWNATDLIWQWIIPTYGPQAAHSGAYVWGPMLNGGTYYGTGYITSPVIDLSANAGQVSSLSWWQWYDVPSMIYRTTVEVSKDGGLNWTPVYGLPADKLAETVWTRHAVSLDPSYSVSTFRVRFYYWGATDQNTGWYVDDVAIQGAGNCPPISGGLVVGNVQTAATGAAVNGAMISDGEGRVTTTVATPADPALANGFYRLFLPVGNRTLTALYGATGEAKQLEVAAGTVSRVDFSLVANGVLQGTVSNVVTGAPLSGATVKAHGFGSITTDASGHYSFGNLPAGTYAVTATHYGYPAATATGVAVASGATVTQDFSLTELPPATVSGRVTDASGHGWPLAARIEFAAAGQVTTVYSHPLTGEYTATLYQDVPFTVTTTVPGYTTSLQQLTIPAGGLVNDVGLTVDRTACTAPGYGVTAPAAHTFDADNGGYTVGGSSSWAWGTPTSGPATAHSGALVWATNLTGNYNDGEDGYLTSPPLDLSPLAGQPAILAWWQWLSTETSYDFASAEVSRDGGATWLSVYGPVSGSVASSWSRVAMQLDPAYSVSDFRVRFRLKSDYTETAAGWYLDDVALLAQSSCQPLPGGLVAGNVWGADSGSALNDTLITDLAGHTAYARPTPELPTVADGFYTLFLPPGPTTLVASHPEYGGEEVLTVAADQITVRDFTLGRCVYVLSPVNAAFPAAGGTGSLTVATGSGCTWAVTDLPSWLSITSGSSGMGLGTVNYAVAANAGTTARSGAFAIRGQAFNVTQGSTYGTLEGYVRNAVTGTGVGGASVTIAGLSTLTDGVGHYRITPIPVGSYDVTVTATAYLPLTVSGVAIASDTVTVRDLGLEESPLVTVQGAVADGSGHGWPLYATLIITAPGFSQTVYTDPDTGQYSIILNKDTAYTFTVSAAGYSVTTRGVTPPAGGSNENFALAVDVASCTAPGYTGAYYVQNFETGNGGGFVTSGTNSSWQWGTPTSGPNSAHSGTRVWATRLNGNYNASEGSYLTSPVIDLSANAGQSTVLSWWQWLVLGNFNDYAGMQVSRDGGATWTNAYGGVSGNVDPVWGRRSVVLDPSYAVSTFKFRFWLSTDQYYTSDTPGLYVDDIAISPAGCQLLPGGLVIGNVVSANTGAGLIGATVTDGASHTAVAIATPNDPAVADGFYALFVPAGSVTLTAASSGYVNNTGTVTVITDAIARQDFSLFKPGILQGTITDGTSGTPLSGALVTATGGYAVSTNGSGFYQFTGVPAGSYDIAVVRAGYQAQTRPGIQVVSDATTVQDLTLAATSPATLQGTVTDGSGHGWPLYAKIDITAPGYAQTIFTNPVTGRYSIDLYYGTTYHVTVTATGYTAATRSIDSPPGGLSENFVLTNFACSAPGYSGADYVATFEGNDGGFVISGNTSWAWGAPTSGPGAAYSGTNVWATNLAGDYYNNENGYLTSPIIDLSNNAGFSSTLSWWRWSRIFTGDQATVEVSRDGGASWATVHTIVATYSSWYQDRVTLGPEYSVKNFRMRFHFTSNNDIYRGAGWYIDDVTLKSATGCQPVAGGLLIGNVYNINTGAGFDGATVTDIGGRTTVAAATPLDPNVVDGFYTLFLPAGNNSLTAAFPGYLSDTKAVSIAPNTVISQDFQLVRPGTLQGTITDAVTGNPLSGVLVTTTGGYSATTNGSGVYQFTAIPPGSHEVTATFYGYQSVSTTDVTVVSDNVTTRNLALTASSPVTLQGIVSDGSGHGWPLYAKIDITAPGYAQTIYTSPATGRYSIDLPYGTTYTITAESAGYHEATRTVALPPEGADANFTLTTSCLALGYAGADVSIPFEEGNGGFVTSGTTSWAWGMPTSGPGTAHSGSRVWATNLAGNYGNNENGSITSPDIDLSSNAGNATTLSWWHWKQVTSGDQNSVEVSKDGGASWTLVYMASNLITTWTQQSISLGAEYAVKNFRVRFRFTSDASTTNAGWYIDDVTLKAATGCQPLTGGLVVGNAYNTNTGSGFNGVTVADGAGHTATAAATPDDPLVADGYYALFLPPGSKTLTASFPGYLSDVRTIDIASHALISQDFNLAKPGILLGAVTDATTGNPISGATVTIAGGPSTTTNGSGIYQFGALLPGTYTVTASAAGQAAQTAVGVVVSSDLTTTQDFTLTTCTYALLPPAASFVAAGGTGSIEVTAPAGCPWSATGNPAWLTFTAGGSGSGPGTIAYSVGANAGTTSRTGTLAVGGQTFTVNQGSSYGTLQGTVTNALTAAPVIAATVTAGSITATTDSAGFYRFAAISAGTYTVTVTAANHAPQSLTDIVVGNDIVTTRDITMTGCTYALLPAGAAFAASGGPGTIDVAATGGCGWTVTGMPSWLTITAGSSGTGNGTIAYSLGANAGTTARTGTLAVGGQTFTVTQGSSYGTLQGTVTNALTAAPISGVTVTAGSFTTTTDSVGFYRFAAITAGTYSVTVTATNHVPQTITDLVVANDTVTTQNVALTKCTYALLPSNSASFSNGSGTGTISVVTPGACSWSVAEALSWVTVTSGSSGTGSGTVNYSVAANPDQAPRTGTMVVGDQSFVISQAGAVQLTVAVSPAGGGTVSGGGINCPGSCGATFDLNTNVTLTALAADGYRLASWTACTYPSGTTCDLTMNATRSVTANFVSVPVRSGGGYFDTLQAAYNAIVTDDTLQLKAGQLLEAVQFDREVRITLKGGYSDDFSTQSGQTAIVGSLTISAGEVTIENIAVQ